METRPSPLQSPSDHAHLSPVRRLDWLMLFPLLCPVVFITAGNDAFGFDPPGWLDSFVYLGYFWHYSEHLWLFDDNSNYKASRLPWILPGVAAHALFPPVTAALVLAYATLASASTALYLHVRDAVRDRHAAAFVSVLLACCTWMHGPGGWYYHAVAAAGFYLWSCWMVIRAAASPRPVAWAIGAGACFAAAVHTHVFLVVFSPFLILLYWAAPGVNGDDRHHANWSVGVAGGIGGGVVLTVALAIVNRATGGAWLFFMPQIEQALKLSVADPYWRPVDQWLPQATYLVLPVAMTIAGVISARRIWNAQERLTGTMTVLPVAALAVMCFFQFFRQQTTLDYPYMAFPLYLHAFPAIGVAVANRPSQRSWLRTALLGLATAIVVLPLLALMPADLPSRMALVTDRVGLGQLPRMVPPLLFSVAGVALARLTPRTFRMVVVAAWISLANAWVAPQPAAYGVETAGIRRQMLETFREADAYTHRLDPSLIGIKYWMSTEDLRTPYGPVPSQHVFDSFLATRAWLTNLFARESPGLPIETLTREHLAAATCVGILSSVERQRPLAEAMMAHYAALDRPLLVIAERRFERQGLAFALTLLRARPLAAEGQSPCASMRELD